MVDNDKAWETLIWIGGLLTRARSLKEHGFIDWFAQAVGVWFTDVSGITVVLVMALVYFYSMYSFSMLSAHIAAMGTVFLAVALGAGAPAMLTGAIFAYPAPLNPPMGASRPLTAAMGSVVGWPSRSMTHP